MPSSAAARSTSARGSSPRTKRLHTPALSPKTAGGMGTSRPDPSAVRWSAATAPRWITQESPWRAASTMSLEDRPLASATKPIPQASRSRSGWVWRTDIGLGHLVHEASLVVAVAADSDRERFLAEGVERRCPCPGAETVQVSASRPPHVISGDGDRALHALPLVELAMELGAPARRDGDLDILAPVRRELFVDLERVRGERVLGAALVLQLERDLGAGRRLQERRAEVEVVELHLDLVAVLGGLGAVVVRRARERNGRGFV